MYSLWEREYESRVRRARTQGWLVKLSDLIRVANAACASSTAWDRDEPYGPQDDVGNYNRDIKRVLYCVTPSFHIAEHAKKQSYDLIIAHHPYPIRGVPMLIYHTALDCAEGGLNDMYRDHLGMQEGYKHFDGTLGWHGNLTKPMAFEDLVAKVKEFSGNIIGETWTELKTIKSVVVCTGLGGMVNELALASGADCYILGQNTMPAAMTGFKAVIEIGHTLSEWHGLLFWQRILKGIKVDLAPVELDSFGTEVHNPKRQRAV